MEEIFPICLGSDHESNIEIDFYQWQDEFLVWLDSAYPKKQKEQTKLENKIKISNEVLKDAPLVNYDFNMN